AFRLTTSGYTQVVSGFLRVSVLALLLYVGLLGLTYWEFLGTRRGFIPSQDMGFLMLNVQLPDSASAERTDQVMRKIEEIALRTPGIRHVTGIGGQSFVLHAAGPNFAAPLTNPKA